MLTIAPVMDDSPLSNQHPKNSSNSTDVVTFNGSAAQPGDFTDRVAAVLKATIGDSRYDLWFDRKSRFALQGNALIVEVPNAFSANWIRQKFSQVLNDAACEAAGRTLEVSVLVNEFAAETPPAAGSNPLAPAAMPKVEMRPIKTGGPIAPMTLKYTLEDFVVGPSNQMAYHAAVRAAEAPGQLFNPLFIHGSCGLGKTHLLQGMCHRFARVHPTRKWLYITGEQFTNEFLEAIRTRKTEALRRKLRSADLLVIDDVHFLANKKATQEEFLHTFNELDACGKQIVLASDCAPRQIHSLSEQLSSRFVSGMVLRVDSPDMPTRLEILRRRVLRNGWSVSDPVLMHIAQSPASSVRELEGLLLQVIAGIKLINQSAPEATTVLASIKDRTQMRGPVPVEKIVNCVAEHFGLQTATILGSGREKAVSMARAVAMFLARRHTGMSYPEIGRAIGSKNHSTVIAACQRVESLVASGDLVCWNTPEGSRHQSMSDLLSELEAAIRRG